MLSSIRGVLISLGHGHTRGRRAFTAPAAGRPDKSRLFEPIRLATPEDWRTLKFDDIIDVRSPSEYAEAHIPTVCFIDFHGVLYSPQLNYFFEIMSPISCHVILQW
jgi:hypothetical protein